MTNCFHQFSHSSDLKGAIGTRISSASFDEDCVPRNDISVGTRLAYFRRYGESATWGKLRTAAR